MAHILNKDLIDHYDKKGEARTPKVQRFHESLEEGRNEVLGSYRLKQGTGHAIAVGLRPNKRGRLVNGKMVWETLR